MKLALPIAVVSMMLFSASEVRADPSPKAEKAAEKAEKPSPKKAKAKAKAKPKAKAPNLRLVEATDASRINLFPASVLDKSKRTPEKRKGVSLGDDRSWKVHAAQAAVMTAVFGALVTLCANGACKIPKAVTDPLPDFMKADPYRPATNPRPPQKLPKLR